MLLSTYSRNKLPSHPYSIVMLLSRTTGLPVCVPVKIHELSTNLAVLPAYQASLAAHAFCRCTYSMQLFQQKESGEREEPGPKIWWSWTDLNRLPPACKAGALPDELQPLIMVGLERLELSTSRLSGVRSNHLSYRPDSPYSFVQ